MSNSVAKRTEVVSTMVKGAAKSRALYGGTDSMREAGTTYLPKMEGESDEAYGVRKNASWLFNGVRKTVRDMTGRVFDVPMVLSGDVPEVLTDWVDNIDLAGRDLNEFAKDVFKDGLLPGIGFILVDAPTRDGSVSVVQARDRNLRPYMVHLPVERVLGWKTQTINNAQTITQFRFMESVEEDGDDEFESVSVDQVRVLTRTPTGVTVRVYRRAEGKDDWLRFGDEVTTGLDEITVVPFYANRTGFLAAEPVLEDLADVNVAHWQSQSDQRHILHVARCPILYAAGYDDPDNASPIKVGSSSAVVFDDPQGKLGFAEHSGNAIGAGRQDLKDLEFQMEALGLQLLVQKVPGQSATGEALDAAKETTQLAMMANDLASSMSIAMGWMARYGGIAIDSVGVEVNTEYGAGGMSQVELSTLLAAVNTGQLSRITFLAELKRRGVLSAKVDPDDEIERVDDEGLIDVGDAA